VLHRAFQLGVPRWPILGIPLLLLVLLACSEPADSGGDGASSSWSQGAGGDGARASGGGPGDGGAATASGGSGGSGGDGGAGSGGAGGSMTPPLDDLLDSLRADPNGALLTQSRGTGWPAPVDGGHLVVSTDPALTLAAGDHDDWAGTPMNADQGFSWVVLSLDPGDRYKLTDGTVYEPDPWARAYDYDAFGLMTMLAPPGAHLERHFDVGGRTVRVWLPDGAATHVLYMHDGQNLFDPEAFFGGWQLRGQIPDGMMVVGIDNTAARMDEYTHVVDDIGSGIVGGDGDDYASFVNDTVRGLVEQHYGEPTTRGVMGSSLGGLISLHMASLYPSTYAFAGSMSGTAGWGSIGLSNETIIERLSAAGHLPVAIYIDSGGSGTCVDADGDGIDDDGNDFDNYCVNLQLADTLRGVGYTDDVDFWHWHELDAPHNEIAWSARVWRPLSSFAAR
jgi:hypothetical protein